MTVGYNYFYSGKGSFKQYIHSLKSSDAIGRAQYIINGNGPLLLIFLENIIYSIIGAGMRL